MSEINVFGWKGKDTIKIKDDGDTFCIIEHRKVKKTGEIEEHKHYVKKEYVKNFTDILFNQGSNYNKYRDIVLQIIKKYKLNINLDAFNGGKNRAKYYFPYYYYPCKILEAKGIIEYGPGTIKLLNVGEWMKYKDFCDDKEKMKDFLRLNKTDFLNMYSYLTYEEYVLTIRKIVMIENVHHNLRSILLNYECPECGDIIIDEICKLFNYPNTCEKYIYREDLKWKKL